MQASLLNLADLMVFFSSSQNVLKQCDILSRYVNRDQSKVYLKYSIILLLTNSILSLEVEELYSLNEVFNIFISSSKHKEKIRYAVLDSDFLVHYFSDLYYNDKFYDNMAYFFNIMDDTEESDRDVQVGDVEEIDILSNVDGYQSDSAKTDYSELIRNGTYTLITSNNLHKTNE